MKLSEELKITFKSPTIQRFPVRFSKSKLCDFKSDINYFLGVFPLPEPDGFPVVLG